jgi:archaellum component FlaC
MLQTEVIEYLLVLQVVQSQHQADKLSIHLRALEHSQWLHLQVLHPIPLFFLTFSNMIEQIDILARQKGYQDILNEVENLQTKSDFIRQVYEGIILGDATREFVAYTTRQKEEARIAEENTIREQVASAITSSIE